MPEDTPAPVPPSPAFPVNLPKQQLQQLTAALLSDSLSLLGVGFPSCEIDSSALQQWLWQFEGGFDDEVKSIHGQAGLDQFHHDVRNPPAIEASANLPPASLLALRTRVLAVIGLLDHEQGKGTNQTLWGVYRQSTFANQVLRGPECFQPQLRSQAILSTIVAKQLRLPSDFGWAHGLTAEDIRWAVTNRLLDAESIYEDFLAWARVVKAGKLGAETTSAELDTDEARAAITFLIEDATRRRSTGIQRAVSELCAIREMEHELIEDSMIDPFCHNLRMGAREKFNLGDRGAFELDSAFGTCENSVPMTSEAMLDLMSELENAAGPTAQESSQKDADARPSRRETNFQSISPTRMFIAWRGAPCSASEARKRIPTVLRATVRTAWLATLGNDPVLEYFADQRYQEADPQYRGAAIQSCYWGINRAYPIAEFPEEFPIRQWADFVLSQAIPGSRDSGADSRSFGINAMRLLNSADELLRVNPGQSFACSMAAVEACLGGKGENLADRVARRSARLLVPEIELRAKAVELIKLLYNTRSRIVHGDDCDVSVRQAAFMRYTASCVVYALAGFAMAAPRFGLPSTEDGLRRHLDEDGYSPGALIGTVTPRFLVDVLKSEILRVAWVGK
jgi:hypothetical protein